MSFELNNLSITFFEAREDEAMKTQVSVKDNMSMARALPFAESLHHVFSDKPSKSYAAFIEDRNTTVFTSLQDYNSDSADFGQLASNVSDVFTAEIEKYEFQEKGYLILMDYDYVGTRYIMFAVISLADQFVINQDFDVKTLSSLDIRNLKLAARICPNEMPYAEGNLKQIQYIKTRSRWTTDFFMDMLGSVESISAKIKSKELIAALDDFMAKEQLAPEEKAEIRESVHQHCSEALSMNEDLNLHDIDDVISLRAEAEFTPFVQEQDYDIDLDDDMPIDATTIKTLVKLSGSGSGVSVSFDRALLGDRVTYNPATDTLSIKGVPRGLKAHLLNEAGLE